MDTPQAHLDRLHEINFSALHGDLTPTQQTELFKAMQKKFKLLKQQLTASISEIKRRYDGRNRDEALQEQRALVPYELVERCYAEAELHLAEVRSALAQHQSPPPAPRLGMYIASGIGNERHVVVGSLREKLQWQLEDVREVGKRFNEALKVSQTTLGRARVDQRLMTGVAIVGSLILIALIMTIPNNDKWAYLPILLAGSIGLVLWIFLSYRTRIDRIQATINEFQQGLLALKRDYHNYQTALESASRGSLLR